MPRRIVVSGAAGFLGSTLVEALLRAGDEVVGIDAFDDTLYPAATKRRQVAPLAASPRFWLIEGSINAPSVWDAALASGADAVVHLGAIAGVRPSLQQPGRYAEVNIGGTIAGLEACRRHRVPHLVLSSSSSVYGVHDAGRLFREDDALGALSSPYAASKRAAELFAEVSSITGGPRTTVLRLFTVYGPRQRPDMAVAQFSALLRSGLPVPLFAGGRLLRDFTFVGDVVAAILATLRVRADVAHSPEPSRCYNIGSSRPLAVSELVATLAAALKVRAVTRDEPMQEGDVPFTGADVSRAKAELGWAPSVSFEEGIARYARWFELESLAPAAAPKARLQAS